MTGSRIYVVEDGAQSKMASILAEIRGKPISFRDASLRVTLSADIVAAPACGTSPDAIPGAADEALYRTRREGRDRNCAASAQRGPGGAEALGIVKFGNVEDEA